MAVGSYIKDFADWFKEAKKQSRNNQKAFTVNQQTIYNHNANKNTQNKTVTKHGELGTFKSAMRSVTNGLSGAKYLMPENDFARLNYFGMQIYPLLFGDDVTDTERRRMLDAYITGKAGAKIKEIESGKLDKEILARATAKAETYDFDTSKRSREEQVRATAQRLMPKFRERAIQGAKNSMNHALRQEDEQKLAALYRDLIRERMNKLNGDMMSTSDKAYQKYVEQFGMKHENAKQINEAYLSGQKYNEEGMGIWSEFNKNGGEIRKLELSKEYAAHKIKKLIQNPSDLIDFAFSGDKLYLVKQECQGHIKMITYNNLYCMMKVEFTNRGDVVVFFDIPSDVAQYLIELGKSNAMAPSVFHKDGSVTERHAVGVEFWSLVRIRGTQHGVRYRFQYVKDNRVYASAISDYMRSLSDMEEEYRQVNGNDSFNSNNDFNVEGYRNNGANLTSDTRTWRFKFNLSNLSEDYLEEHVFEESAFSRTLADADRLGKKLNNRFIKDDLEKVERDFGSVPIEDIKKRLNDLQASGVHIYGVNDESDRRYDAKEQNNES